MTFMDNKTCNNPVFSNRGDYNKEYSKDFKLNSGNRINFFIMTKTISIFLMDSDKNLIFWLVSQTKTIHP